jgi:membrane associated rhomboid family serine protease
MLENRDYMRQPMGRFHWSATMVLLAVNIAISVIEYLLIKAGFVSLGTVDRYFALSLAGLRHGFIWQLLTFQVLHANFWHLLFNCWALYVFGPVVEDVLGKQKFLLLYFIGGVVGGLFQELVALIWPVYFGSAVVGASAGIFGVVSAFAMLFPERQLTMLLFFVIPITMRAKFLLVINLVITALGISFPQTILGGNVAHAAHLGGILTGLAFIRMREELGSWKWPRLRPRPIRNLKILSRTDSDSDNVPENPSEEFISREVDPILDKISAHGIQSLTDRERKILEAARNRVAKR